MYLFFFYYELLLLILPSLACWNERKSRDAFTIFIYKFTTSMIAVMVIFVFLMALFSPVCETRGQYSLLLFWGLVQNYKTGCYSHGGKISGRELSGWAHTGQKSNCNFLLKGGGGEGEGLFAFDDVFS